MLGKITSVKGAFAYLRLNQSKLCIGRLHQTECPNFKDLFVGERVKAKVLAVSEDKRGTSLFDLTTRAEHMAAALLDEGQLGVQKDQLEVGKKYSAVV